VNIKCNSSNLVQVELCRAILARGTEVNPRGLLTRELLGVSFVIENPRNRLTSIPGRKWSPSLAIAELAWNLRAERSVEPLAFYAPKWRSFADDSGIVRGSCYGASIFGPSHKSSQWSSVAELLRREISTRRAVLSLRAERDVSAPTNDMSCTNTIQFIVREGRLHAFVNMRSNDVIWGVPYDVFLFSTLQEFMAVELGLDVGSYHHYAASMHIYERHFSLASSMASINDLDLEDGGMPPIESGASLMRLAYTEKAIREGGTSQRTGLTDFETFALNLLQRSRALAA